MRRLGDLASIVDGTVVGDSHLEISGAAILRNATGSEITFAFDQKYYQAFLESDATTAVVGSRVEIDPASTKSVIVSNDPESAFSQIVAEFRPPIVRRKVGISAAAIISPSAMISDDVSIYPGAVIMDRVKIGCGAVIHSNVTVMENCTIGANTTLYPSCTLYENTVVGDRTILHAGVVLGCHGFGYKSASGQHQLSSQLGNVVVGNDVEIGANSTIDRGTFDSTTIGDGTKLDDLVMIGHNCSIGPHNLLCSQVGIAGSSTTGSHVVMGGQVGVGDHLDIGSRVLIAAKSGLMSSVDDGQKIFGVPAKPARETMQIIAATAKLPELRKQFKEALKRIDELESKLDSTSETCASESAESNLPSQPSIRKEAA